ncbi:hypothetical protein L0663_03645 [Dyadobacter sp. CY107]|uniref:hypothetical protein n=1 Tax=Dyadobacter fanqingshengii TaxID=2906443 RepID=UPI001F234519|nr:hypothetical protein [Dyadobacter fanqingshengii]MCF2502456.1 hypothetical protein [Dyadobacter fanqingshengii]
MEHTIKSSPQLRLRVFAGPNGSGKSTLNKVVRETTVNNRKIDVGIYINADDIAVLLRIGSFSFSLYGFQFPKKDIIEFALNSGLLSPEFEITKLKRSFKIQGSRIVLIRKRHLERLAQIIARFLREKLLEAKKRFSFETVFSHESNLDIMRRAADQGYKVYFYFVSTESPRINEYRVALRVNENGHGVPLNKIESRYYRSMELVRQASAIAYQAYFFDNSVVNESIKLVGHFKRFSGVPFWDEIDEEDVSQWFYKYCADSPQ